jgi:hypothetical protein
MSTTQRELYTVRYLSLGILLILKCFRQFRVVLHGLLLQVSLVYKSRRGALAVAVEMIIMAVTMVAVVVVVVPIVQVPPAVFLQLLREQLIG